MKKERITYGEASAQIGIHHRAIRFVLKLIQAHCLSNKLPPLTILVVNRTGKLGSGFIAYDSRHLDDGVKKVFRYNWEIIEIPFLYSKDGTSLEPVIEAILKGRSLSQEQRALLKVRGSLQSIFRSVIMKANRKKCAICLLSIPYLLEAAHIRPWENSSDEEKVPVNSELMLCRNHHILFDNDIIDIDPNYSLTIDYSAIRGDLDRKYLSQIDQMSSPMLIFRNSPM